MRITGQVLYMGPQLPTYGLQYGAIFRDGIHEHLYEAIEKCPALGALFIPVKEVGKVRRELNFDIAHQMRGTGLHCTFYRAVEEWRATHTKQKKPTAAAVTIENHHA